MLSLDHFRNTWKSNFTAKEITTPNNAPNTSNLEPTPSTRNSEPIEDAEPPKQQDSLTSETATPNALELAAPAALETERGFEYHRPHDRSNSSIEKRKAKKAAHRKAKQEEEEGKE